MALVLANRVQETATPNTTVSFTLTGAVAGFQNFAVIGNTNTTYYSATDAVGNWEVGLGTYSTTGPTLNRTTVYASSNAGSAVTFSGSVNVFVTYPSGKSVNLDENNNLGIGTSSPVGKLDVSGTTFSRFLNSTAPTLDNDTHAGEALFIRSGGSAGINNVQAVLAFGKADGSSIRSGSAIASIQTTSDADQIGLSFYTSVSAASAQTMSERMRLDASGNLGIGTSSPLSPLHVAGDIRSTGDIIIVGGAGTPEVQFFQNAGNWKIAVDNDAMQFVDSSAAAERMRLDGSGNLGLGVTPNASWATANGPALQIGSYASVFNNTSLGSSEVAYNTIRSGSDAYVYNITGIASSRLQQRDGAFRFFIAPSGTAGNAISFTQAMTLDASGNLLVGGTASVVGGTGNLELLTTKVGGATDLLVSNSSNTASSRARVWISNGGTSAGSANLLFTSGLAGTRLVMGVDSTDADKFKIGNGYNVGSGTTYLTLTTAGQLLLNITAARTNFAGNTTTPLLQIEGITAGTASASIVRGVADALGSTFNLGKTRSAAVAGNTVVASGDQLGIINFQGADGTNLLAAASIQAAVDGAPGTNDMPGRLVFSTTADGASTPTERARITSNGSFQIGSVTGIDPRLFVYDNDSTDAAIVVRQDGAAPIQTWQGASGVERMRIDATGNLLVGTTTNTNSSRLVVNGTISETVGGVQYQVVSQADIGTAANEIPLNQYLGALAYEDTETPALDVGTGITTGVGTICKANGGSMGGIYRMTILIDLTGLNSGGTAGDIIGVNGTALPCYIARLPAMTVLGGRMTCLETPAGGDTDIDLYSATEGTGVEDQAISALTETEIINAGAQTRGTVTYFSADPAANAYFYLVGQGTANATYTAGRFLIEIFGVQ